MSRTSKSPPPAPADSSRSRTTTRQRSDFNLEPNPFEQSFSATPRSASSNVRGSSPHRESLGPSSNDSNSKSDPDRPASRAKSRASQRRSASPSRPLLPPLASISSPADNGFAWGYPPNSINSLRAGPLSPAMLAGPQPSGDSNHVPFDSNYRTGLTPRTGMTPHSGLTPGTGLTPLVGAGAFPGSPNTSAFMAMINNGASGPTITPNTLNAISGVLNGTANNYTSSNLHQSHTAQDNSFLASANNAASTAANGLFLLSQAHQELTKREEAQARAGNNTSNTVPQNGQPNGKRGTKRKSYDMSSPPPPTLSTNRGGKRTRAPSGRRKPALRGESEDLADMDDDMDDDDMENDMDGDDGDLNPNGRRGNKKPETEEEKRRNFLERNRQGTLCLL